MVTGMRSSKVGGAAERCRVGAAVCFFSRVAPNFPRRIPASPGRESLLLIVQTQFLCAGAVRTKNCVWTSVAEISTSPAGPRNGREAEERPPERRKVTDPERCGRTIGRKPNKQRWRCSPLRSAGCFRPTAPQSAAAPGPLAGTAAAADRTAAEPGALRRLRGAAVAALPDPAAPALFSLSPFLF